jgi:hypothetical protein
VRKLLWLIPLLCCFSHAQTFTGCSSPTSLGNGWTCEGGASKFGTTGTTNSFPNAVNLHDVIIGWCGNGVNSAGATVVPSDNAGNTWDYDTILYTVAVGGAETVSYAGGTCSVSGGTGPKGATCTATIVGASVTAVTVNLPGIYLHSGGAPTVSVSNGSGQTFTPTMGNATWNNPATSQYTLGWVLDSAAKASGYQFTCTSSSGSPDEGAANFRYTGGASQGIETPQQQTNGVTLSATGTCPCAAGNQTIVTTHNGDLIIMIGNEINGGFDTATAGFIGADGGQLLANTQSSAGSINVQWTDTNASDPIFSGLAAFRNSSTGGPPANQFPRVQ